MTSKQLYEALLNKTPIVHNGIRYQRVTAVIYRANKEGPYVSAELLDATGNSVTIARAEKIDPATEGGAA